MRRAPIVVHRPSAAGGRRVTVHRRGRDEILGTAYSDHDLVVFLEALGVPDPDGVLSDPKWLEWRDGPDRLWPTPPDGR
ncbi:hypothetical protein [Streptomyces luteolus]|uniref:Uncharacterized protein n=1 Tax=Streptomyces luteolus TaxID=3043615 RepID=A0ABT6SV35_9ACTN|nr:hypothetical protein [Streptomyces sp. B-S-A12]MDI3418482.1 hypothetical protein [Streptomyces sp. B-S-A12]